MPIYEYRCSVCHHETEVLHGMNETIDQVCPQGCGNTLARLVSAPKVRFSGQGYYETDEKPKEKQRNVLTKDEPASSSAASCPAKECKSN